MKIKLDENIGVSTVVIFKEYRYEADTVFSEGLQGASDDVIFQRARSENRLLITCDLDFADIRHFPPSASGGVLVLRLANKSSKSVASRIKRLLETTNLSELTGSITIVSEDRIRIRRS